MKLSDLIEQRAPLLTRMQDAHTKDDSAAFEAAQTELRTLDGKIDRQKVLDEADRRADGVTIHGDAKLDHELRTNFKLGRAIAGAAGLGVDWGFEREMQGELAKRAGRAPGGVFIPTEIFETRVLTTTTGAEDAAAA